MFKVREGKEMKKNPNELNYPGGKKHFVDVIKNTGAGDMLIWLNPQEDFNSSSTLIVAESEEALFFHNGVVEQVFGGGRHKLSTENYPVLSRIRNAFSGGISSYNCKIYFVRIAHTEEIYWGTATPIQVRDPVHKIATKIRMNGTYRVQIENSKKFLLKLVGNNVQFKTKDDLSKFFRAEFIQHLKSVVTQTIISSNEEILGICAQQETLAKIVSAQFSQRLDEYGIRLVSFAIRGMDIPEDDPNRQMLEESFAKRGVRKQEAYAKKEEQDILGINWEKREAAEILRDVANNPNSGGLANAGAGLGMAMGAAGVFSGMANQMMSPMQPQGAPASSNKSGMFEQVDENDLICSECSAVNPADSKFCNQCGAKIEVQQTAICPNCSVELKPGSRFCNNCGAKV